MLLYLFWLTSLLVPNPSFTRFFAGALPEGLALDELGPIHTQILVLGSTPDYFGVLFPFAAAALRPHRTRVPLFHQDRSSVISYKPKHLLIGIQSPCIVLVI